MPESKSGSNLRQVNRWQREAARAEYLRHPDASISDVVKATGVATRTVARAREQLVKEGLLAPGRNSTISGADAAALAMSAASLSGEPDVGQNIPIEPVIVAATRGSKAGQTIDGEALRQMNDLLDQLADEDDDTTRKRMLKQVKRFAFDPNLHPDTRMSASQLWAKLLDMQRAKDLGPGVPMTQTKAIDRATDFTTAVGPLIMTVAFFKAFDRATILTCIDSLVQMLEVPNGAPTAEAVEQGQPSPAPADPAGPTNDVSEVRPEA